MVKIKVRKGLQLRLAKAPEGELKVLPEPKKVALDVSEHERVRFVLRKKEGEKVDLGEPLLHDKMCEERCFTAPASGTIIAVNRGEKRHILNLVIEKEGERKWQHEDLSGDQLPEKLAKAGLFAYIRKRPGNVLPDPKKSPDAIFVKGIESAPFAAPSSMEAAGNEEYLKEGLCILATMAPVHIVGGAGLPAMENVYFHESFGKHPCGNHSVHIYHIHPILDKNANIWTLDFSGLIAIGMMALEKGIYASRVIGIGGVEQKGFYKTAIGHPLDEMGINWGDGRIISGDPLMGKKVDTSGFLGFTDRAISVISEKQKRQLMHFIRPGFTRYTATRTYLSRLFRKKEYQLTTALHGEERAFVDGSIYQKVMPMKIPVMELVKAIMTENFEEAEALGLLEVAPEDFALPSFLCPSKIPMTEIVRQGLWTYAEQNF